MIKAIGIVGLARTGKSLFEFLQTKTNINLLVYDDKIEHQSTYERYFVDINQASLWNQMEYIVVSPGIPESHSVFKLKPKKISDIELFYLFKETLTLNPMWIVGITGTNGKSTITEQIATMLNTKGFGNIGLPIFDYFKKEDINFKDDDKSILINALVLEISSFQLDLQDRFRPDIAIITNISEDHLDRYKNIQSYIESKLKILDNMTPNDIGIINLDDEGLNKLKNEGRFDKYRCKFIYVSKANFNLCESLMWNISILHLIGELNEVNLNFLFSLTHFQVNSPEVWMRQLPSISHDFSFFTDCDFSSNYYVQNTFLSLYALALLLMFNMKYKVSFKEVAFNQNQNQINNDFQITKEFLVSIKKHFLLLNLCKKQDFCNQIIAKKHNLWFVNDSKGTNPYSTAKAIESLINRQMLQCLMPKRDIESHAESFEKYIITKFDICANNEVKIFLLAGGVFKNSSIEPILKFKSFIHKVYLYGQDKYQLRDMFLEHKIDSVVFDNLQEGLISAYEDCKSSSENIQKVILFSPMCASLDQFTSFKQRGEAFNIFVSKLK